MPSIYVCLNVFDICMYVYVYEYMYIHTPCLAYMYV